MSDATPLRLGAGEGVFVVGADGMLGSRLVAAFRRDRVNVWGSTRREATVGSRRVYLDLANDVGQFSLPFSGGGTAILSAAHTSIDQCQRDPKATRRINVENTLALARKLSDAGMFVVFLSSNTVFDGLTAYTRAHATPNPQNEYGRQKADVEAQLLSMGDTASVIRFSKIIAPDMPVLSSWIRDLRSGVVVHPFSDAVMAPLSAAFATEVVVRAAIRKHSGLIQASASDDISYADAAKYLATNITADIKLIIPISSKTVGTFAFPSHTTLDSTKLSEFGLEAPLPTDALDDFIDATRGGTAAASR
jgi:dTDP-4-dehydrorhamnose reductase